MHRHLFQILEEKLLLLSVWREGSQTLAMQRVTRCALWRERGDDRPENRAWLEIASMSPDYPALAIVR